MMNTCASTSPILQKLSAEEIAKVEAQVNEKIRENIPVVIKEMPKRRSAETRCHGIVWREVRR